MQLRQVPLRQELSSSTPACSAERSSGRSAGAGKLAPRAAMRRCAESEDYKEGRRAFMEKRKPRFRGA